MIPGHVRLLALLLLVLTADAQAASAALNPARLPSGVQPVHYDIQLQPDADHLTFSGHETIDITVGQAARVITLNAVDLQIDDVMVDGKTRGEIAMNEERQTATFTFPRTLPVGQHQLSMSFKGRIAQSAAGLFALDYTNDGRTKRMLTTQLEAADGRRFLPMWDEPSAKATFSLEVFVPKGQVAFSNMPEASRRTVDDKQYVRFQTTPKMSSYLLHLTVGDLERTSRKVAGVDVGVVARKGASAQTAFALDAAAEILPWYNDYFGTPYPLPKLDMIAAPGQSQYFGAMENWGAILYFEHVLLVDPKDASESDRQNIFNAIAHEMAHQWFGDLVTMEWWDDLWLNEGFATWMASKISASLHPQWKPWLQVVGSQRERALRLDAGAATHPIVVRIDSIDGVNQAFDAIAYQKGEAVIRMLEDTVGDAAFRDGIRRYMAKYAYDNTVTDQLWGELDAGTGKRISDIAHDFTLQPGVPLVSVTTTSCQAGITKLRLTQSRFETDTVSATKVRWRIPVSIAAVDGSGGEQHVILDKNSVAQVDVPGCGPFVVNHGQAGYFRTFYPRDELERLQVSFNHIETIDQLGLLNDTAAFGDAGLLPAPTYLDFVAAVDPAADPLVWLQVTRQIQKLDRVFDGSPAQAAWRARAIGWLRPQMERTGLTRRPGEGENIALLRESLILTLGSLGDATIVAEARSRFKRAGADPTALPSAIKEALLTVTAMHADAETWEEMRKRARVEADPLERKRLYDAVGAPLDPAIASRALQLAVSGEPPPTVGPTIIRTVADRHPRLALDFALAHEQAVLGMVEESSRSSFVASLPRTSADIALADTLLAYERKSIPAGARRDADEAIAEIRRRATSNARSRPELEAWVSGRPTSVAYNGVARRGAQIGPPVGIPDETILAN